MKGIFVYASADQRKSIGMELSLVEELMIESLENPYLKIAGLHYFSGTQKTDVSFMTQELLYLNGIYKQFKKRYGIELDEMEYGPGIYVEIFRNRKDGKWKQPSRN